MTQIITSDQSTCILCMLLRSTFFDDTLQGDDQMMIYNRSGMLLWQSDSNMAGLSEQTIPAALGVSGQVVHIQENQHQSLYAIGLDECDWVLIYRKDKSDFIRQTSDIILYFALAFLISAALSMTLSRIVAGRLAKPLHHLSQAAATYTVKSEKPVFYQPEYAPKGLSNQIMTFFIWVVILPVIFYSSVTYLFFAQRMQQYIIDSHRKACERAAENIDFYLLSKENAGENIIYDSLTQQVLKRGSDDADRLELAIFYQQNSLLQQGNDDFFLYDLAGVCQFSTRFSSAGSSDDKLAFTFPQRQDGVIQWQISKDRFANNLLYLIFKVNDINYYNMIGAACMVVPEYQMASIYQGLAAENVEIFVMDKQNVILSHVDKGQIGSVYPDEIAEPPSTWLRSRAESIAIFTPIGTRDWQLVSAYSSWFFERDKLIFLYEKIVVLLGSVGLILVMANLMAFMMTRPVKRYAQSLQDLARSGYDGAFSEETPISELNNLGKAFNEMILRNEALMDQLLTAVQRQNELSTQKKDAEIISLQAQINPHFLYNTFESINWMIKRDRKKEATQMIRLLSEMLRYAAQIDRPLITLSEELQYTKAYVDIMNMRYQGILDYQVDVDPELTAVKTLKLILQPFVENAILHGIAPKMAPGCIHIVCAQEASGLVITITDDGVGLSDDRIIQINKELARRCEGIGIYNVQNRIRLMFGEGYGVSVGRRAGGGTSVSLVLPLDRSPNPSPSTGSYA
jgi:two-component system sensor histidine kinase YesM